MANTSASNWLLCEILNVNTNDMIQNIINPKKNAKSDEKKNNRIEFEIEILVRSIQVLKQIELNYDIT